MLTLLTALCVAAPIVVVDGERVPTTEVSSNGFVVFAGHVRLWLPGDRDWTLTTEWSKRDDALLVFDQDRTLVGIALNTRANASKRFVDRDISSVRGFAAVAWTPAIASLVRRLPQPSCVAVGSAPAKLDLKTLPVGLRCLDLEFERTDARLTVDLSRFSKLEWLRLEAGEHAQLAAVPKSVRQVRLIDLRLDGPAMAQLSTVESLVLNDVHLSELTGTFAGLTELSFSARTGSGFKAFEAPRLSRLDVRGPARAALELTLPALSEAVFLDTDFSAESLAAFKNRHRGAAIVTEWTGFYRHQLRKTDRVRVRSGGACHRQKRSEKTLLELSDATEIQGLLAATVLDVGERGSICMCCGGPTMEFFSDGVLLESVSFQHGAALRWSEMFGDTRLGSEALVRFLADRKVTEPLDELTKAAREHEAADSWRTACLALLPSRLHEVFDKGSDDELLDELRKEFPDRLSRLRLLLSLHGAKPASLTAVFGIQDAIEGELASVSALELIAVSASRPLVPELEEGLLRLLLSAKPPAAAMEPMVARLVVELATKGLQRPWAEDRIKAVGALARVPDQQATLLLRRLVTGELPFNTMNSSTPSGAQWVRYAGSQFEVDLPRDATTARLASRDLRVLAAWALVLRGANARSEILALRKQLAGDDAALLDTALTRLDAADGGTPARH